MREMGRNDHDEDHGDMTQSFMAETTGERGRADGSQPVTCLEDGGQEAQRMSEKYSAASTTSKENMSCYPSRI